MTVPVDLPIEVVRQRLLHYRPADCSLPHRGDHELNPGMPFPLSDDQLKPAAVLIPIIDRQDGPTVLLTQRVDTLRNHAGQIAFPGGRLDGPDETPFAGALREAQEEVGLEPRQVEIIGSLDCYRTRTGYNITPVVGIIQPGFSLRLQEMEVADAFEVPLSHLIDPAHRLREAREFQGVPRFFYAIPYGPRYIWGATAGIIVNLAEVLLSPAEAGSGRAETARNAQGAIS